MDDSIDPKVLGDDERFGVGQPVLRSEAPVFTARRSALFGAKASSGRTASKGPVLGP
jgi:hypothetical protein